MILHSSLCTSTQIFAISFQANRDLRMCERAQASSQMRRDSLIRCVWPNEVPMLMCNLLYFVEFCNWKCSVDVLSISFVLDYFSFVWITVLCVRSLFRNMRAVLFVYYFPIQYRSNGCLCTFTNLSQRRLKAARQVSFPFRESQCGYHPPPLQAGLWMHTSSIMQLIVGLACMASLWFL